MRTWVEENGVRREPLEKLSEYRARNVDTTPEDMLQEADISAWEFSRKSGCKDPASLFSSAAMKMGQDRCRRVKKEYRQKFTLRRVDLDFSDVEDLGHETAVLASWSTPEDALLGREEYEEKIRVLQSLSEIPSATGRLAYIMVMCLEEGYLTSGRVKEVLDCCQAVGEGYGTRRGNQLIAELRELAQNEFLTRGNRCIG